uniref:Uncharacterized protein n=1 Tax=Candidatus Kentrum sp. LFY TaxID=2126342 RepID=A0A450V1N9_9GAMM|nr:MAG: hypothetical protein BECKLFY1418B_GA0070995_11271 [Candidatus Kentron sp. LFY]
MGEVSDGFGWPDEGVGELSHDSGRVSRSVGRLSRVLGRVARGPGKLAHTLGRVAWGFGKPAHGSGRFSRSVRRPSRTLGKVALGLGKRVRTSGKIPRGPGKPAEVFGERADRLGRLSGRICNSSSTIDMSARMFGGWLKRIYRLWCCKAHRFSAIHGGMMGAVNFHGKVEHGLPRHPGRECRDPVAMDGNRFGCGPGRARVIPRLAPHG